MKTKANSTGSNSGAKFYLGMSAKKFEQTKRNAYTKSLSKIKNQVVAAENSRAQNRYSRNTNLDMQAHTAEAYHNNGSNQGLKNNSQE